MAMSLQRTNYDHLPQPGGPYVHAVRCGDLLYLSGLTAFGSPMQGGSLAEQAEVVLGQIQSVAAAEGVDLSALVKVTIFVTHLNEIDELRAVLQGNYGDHLPASSLVQVAGLFSPELSIEIEAVLALGGT